MVGLLEGVVGKPTPQRRRLGWPEPRRSDPIFGTPLPEEMRSLGYPTWKNLRGTPLPEEMRSLGYPAKNFLRGTIAILKGSERVAREEGKSLSAGIQDALKMARRQRLRGEWKATQGYWSARAREKGLLKEEDLDRILRRR